jgi:hypothetical protein
MDNINEDQIQLDSIEAFLRRASEVDMPFMVKGSIITRQYLPSPEMRLVADLDFVYLGYIHDPTNAGPIFSSWATQVTEMDLNDHVQFRSFRENDFWRMIDYAMDDDFPTVDTDLLCWVDGIENDRLGLDISFNLDVDFSPVEMTYQPRIGEPFQLKYTCPLSLQISWKLHQLLVRPRLKDVFDLIVLLQHKEFDQITLEQTLYALKKECKKDNVSINGLIPILDKSVEQYFERKDSNTVVSKMLKHILPPTPSGSNFKYLDLSSFKYFTTKEHFPYTSRYELFKELRLQLLNTGFSIKKIRTL